MRNILQMIPGGAPVVVGLALAGLLLSVVPCRPQMWLYPLVRQAVQMKVNYQTRDMLAKTTPHFIIRYTEKDADTIDMVAQAAEAAYQPVTAALNYAPGGKTLILVYPDRQAMKQAYGWAGDAGAMGFYWGGIIQILSPKAWMKDSQSVAEFMVNGPIVHEYTHLVLDYMTRGNYTRWFTEGLAQYVEYRVNGYEWVTADNGLGGKLYTMAELDGNFDGLPNQALAYRQSLALVRYIDEVHGDAKLNQVLGSLKAGVKVDKAIEKALGMDYGTYESLVNAWAKGNMKQYVRAAN
ncbi:hypothetical protein SCACP_37730 [Sporomusa carbonis]|uniref:peptidase MA family metallohydrolase n=1 Tax=Sporomusa carbonis TaxID=3076075 RepID=UPI003A70EDF3